MVSTLSKAYCIGAASLGMMQVDGDGWMDHGDTTWGKVIKYVWDRLQFNEFNLHLGVATIWQAGIATRDFAQEFEWYTRDVGIAEEDTKVHLV